MMRSLFAREPAEVWHPYASEPNTFTSGEYQRLLELMADWWSWDRIEITEERAHPYRYARRIQYAAHRRLGFMWNLRFSHLGAA